MLTAYYINPRFIIQNILESDFLLDNFKDNFYTSIFNFYLVFSI